MPGAVSPRATPGIRVAASSMLTDPAAAIGSHGTWLGRVSYQPWPAITAVAVYQPPSRIAAAPPSSAARFRPRPARTAPVYSAMQVAAAIAVGPAMVSAHT